MCFSAPASFIAAAAVTLVGAASIQNTREKRLLLVAAIPVLFGIQQFFEGLLWLTFDGQLDLGWRSTGMLGFLFFALVLWPVWVPLSIWRAEEQPGRRRYLLVLLALGCVYAAYNLYLGLTTTVVSGVIDHSIRYTFAEGIPGRSLTGYLYLLFTILPFLLSSTHWLCIVGIAMGIGYWIADLYYSTTFVSVWCFFAAIISLLIYVGIRFERKGP